MPREGPFPIEDAGIISLLLYNPPLAEDEKRRYLSRLSDEQAKRVARILLGFDDYASATQDVKDAIDRVNDWRKRNGIPSAKRDEGGQSTNGSNGSHSTPGLRKSR